MIFDTHAHYYDDAFEPDRDALLAALPARGLALAVCPGCDLASSAASVALAERYDFLYAAVGFHPENLEGAALADLDQVRALAAHPRVRAIGEIGLDYYWVKTPEARAFSRDFFDAQLSLAEELDLPVIVHSCGSSSWAFEDFIEIGVDAVDTLQPEAANMAPAYLKEHFGTRLGYRGCISTAGPLAYGTAEEVREYVRGTLSIMMQGGGYHFAPTHDIQDNSPTENVIAMYQAAHDFGRY